MVSIMDELMDKIGEIRYLFYNRLSGEIDVNKKMKWEEIIYWLDKIQEIYDIDSLDDNNKYSFYSSIDPKFLTLSIEKPKQTVEQKYKIGKFLKLIEPKMPDHIISSIVSAYNSTFNVDIFNDIIIVEGKEILKYYKCDYTKNSTSELARSCMNNKPDNYFDLYVNNPNQVKMAILLDNNGELLARALIWKTDKGYYIDRVYYKNESSYNYMINWSEKSGYSRDKNKKMIVNLDYFEKGSFYPYLDTFNWGYPDYKILSNKYLPEYKGTIYELKSSNGGYRILLR